MYEQLVDKISEIGQNKVAILKGSKAKYLILSMLAGVYVGFGILLIFSIGGMVGDSPFKKLLMGLSFGIALSLVLMVGSELFTGNNMIMTVASLDKKVKCWIPLKYGFTLTLEILQEVYYWRLCLYRVAVQLDQLENSL